MPLLLGLAGCAGTGGAPAEPPREAAAAPAEAVAASEPLASRAFPAGSLYPLLVAEFALRRQDYGTALEHYMAQAPRLLDAGISSHASRLAQYMRRHAEAITATRLWLELEPDNVEARLTLANLLARLGRGDEALPHMRAIVRAGGIANFTALATGFDELDGARQDAMLADIGALRREFPANAQLMICQALMLEALGQRREALAALQGVFEQDTRQLQALVLEARLRQELGDAEHVYGRIESVLAEQPDNSRLRLQYARLLTRTDMAAAREQFQLLLDESPDDPDLLFPLALLEREAGELAAARDKLRKLVGRGQRRDEAHYQLGRIAEQELRGQDAIMHYLQVRPGRDFVNATRRLADILLATSRIAEHRAYFGQLRQRFPALGQQLYAVEVESLNQHGRYADATEVLDRALAELPDSTSLQYLRSIALERQGDLAGMEADLRAILAREPDNATALNALGYTLANRTQRYAEAQALIEKALELEPDEPAILDSYGWVRYRLGDYQQALEYLRLAYQALPDPEVAAHLGEVLWVLGQTDAAREIWAAALGKDPRHAIVLETMRRLGATGTE